MRFESFTIEKYGLIDNRTLHFPLDPGLLVIYGPNEAGKSTSLSAIGDFLYGIPERTSHGQNFGNNQIRLTAGISLANGERLTMRRRKGRAGRTLSDDKGQSLEEAILSRHLGAVGRERFSSLFGLDHNTLRSGGERLLKADGDIGRLIVEAGGGLRALVDMIDQLDSDADALFSTTRAGHRAFYKTSDAYKTADDRCKEGLLTRDSYEHARKQQNESQAKVEAVRSNQKQAGERISKLQRLVRVIPTIREFDVANAELDAFGDLPNVHDGFADAAKKALDAAQQAESALAEAAKRCTILGGKIDALAPSAAILAAETPIRDIQEMATHVRKARGDRRNRQDELDTDNRKLAGLRRALGLTADADLEAASPALEAIERVQKLATQGLAHRARITGFEELLAKENRTLATLAARQTERREAGYNEPAGVTITEIANLSAISSIAETKKRQADQLSHDVGTRVEKLAFAGVKALAAWLCPDAATIQTEIARRALLDGEFAKIIEKTETETTKRDTAADAIERLMRAKDVPTDEIIAGARVARDEALRGITDRYLSTSADEVASRAIDERKADVEEHRQQAESADRLVDRKSLEAERIAALDLAQRQKADGVIALAALEKHRTELNERRQSILHDWEQAWPEATKLQPDLGRLKTVVDERKQILDVQAALKSLSDEIEQQNAEIEPRRSALEQAELKLKLTKDGSCSLSDRVSAVSKAIKIHEDAYADFRQDAKSHANMLFQHQETQASLDDLRSLETKWRTAWTPALATLGLGSEVDQERANGIATQWANALGVIDAMKLTRKRLLRMDDDDQKFQNSIAAVASTLDFALPDDCLAAATMLSDQLETSRSIAKQKQTLTAELTESKTERDTKQRAFDAALSQIGIVCTEAACERSELEALIARIRQRDAAKHHLNALAETINKAGDALPLEVLREQWGERDLDLIKVELAQIEEDARRLGTELESALGDFQDRTREMQQFLALGGVNEAVAARESATAEMHDVIERYLEVAMAKELLSKAMEKIRAERQDPLITRAGTLFSSSTRGTFSGVDADVDEQGDPVVVGRRANGTTTQVKHMSDGVRDQLFLAFRIASIEQYCTSAEPLPFVADDLLVHFDDDRGDAALGLLAELGKATQVLLFTHHRHVRDAAQPLVKRGVATLLELA